MTTVHIKRQINSTYVRTPKIEIVSIEDIREEMREVPSFGADPYVVLRRKTKNLASLLNCTESEAERLILERV